MFDLKAFNTYQLEALAENVCCPCSLEELVDFIKKFPNATVLGHGSNIILNQKYYSYEKPFVLLRESFSNLNVEGCRVIAEAGVSLKKLSVLAWEHSLTGVEIFYDVPATVGGALWMNAGAYGASIYDCLESLQTLTRTGEVKTYLKSDIHYAYRHTMFQNMDEIIISAIFAFEHANQDEIKTKMDEILAIRRSKLPHEPSGGSVFKRPNYHISVGEMVENLGLKGFTMGGAQISAKHGGVIVNGNAANSNDILGLIDKIKREVKRNYQVDLELEQVVI